jgi:hypothetical protein
MRSRSRRLSGIFFAVGVFGACSGVDETVNFTREDASVGGDGNGGTAQARSGGGTSSAGGSSARGDGGSSARGGAGGFGSGANGGAGGTRSGTGGHDTRPDAGAGGTPGAGGNSAAGGHATSNGGAAGNGGSAGSGGVLGSGGVFGSGGTPDAGTEPDAGSGASCADNGGCRRGELCETAVGACGSTGACVALPRGCSKVVELVCACDDTTYVNPCVARAAGVSIMHFGACPDECSRKPSLSCCFDDADCKHGSRCLASTCGNQGNAPEEGVCERATLLRGECWDDADCGRGRLCNGASLCPCGAACSLGDSPGQCVAE